MRAVVCALPTSSRCKCRHRDFPSSSVSGGSDSSLERFAAGDKSHQLALAVSATDQSASLPIGVSRLTEAFYQGSGEHCKLP